MLKRLNKTIREINIETHKIEISTFKGPMLKSKTYTTSFSDLKVSQFKFRWYGKREKIGVIIHINGLEKDLYLVKDYFDEYNNIISNLITLVKHY